MWRWSFAWVLGISIWGISLGHGVMAATSAVLHVDQAFVDHGAQFDLFEGQFQVRWTAGGIAGPSDLHVRVVEDGMSVHWASSDALGPTGAVVSFPRASVPSSTTWEIPVIQFREPFGNWKDLPTTFARDRVEARMQSPEGRFRIVLRPKGMREGKATWYKYKKCDCAASPDFPKGTLIRVMLEEDPSKSVVVKVNDWGPDRALFPERVIDLDSVAFKKIAALSSGVIRVRIEPLASTTTAMLF